MLSENEPFSISRESFESYRRSFVWFKSLSSRMQLLTITCTGHLRPIPHIPTRRYSAKTELRLKKPTNSKISNQWIWPLRATNAH